MTRNDMIEILEWHPSHVEHGESGLLSRIERVVAVAVAAEREACLQLCVASKLIASPSVVETEAINQCAAAIRARGQQ